MLSRITEDVRYAIRVIRNAPAFSCAAIVTLGLGIGANTTIFTVVNAQLLRPLPYPHPRSLVLVAGTRTDQAGSITSFSYPRFVHLQEQSRSYAGLAAFTNEVFNLTGRGDPEQLLSARVSRSFFEVLGVQPAMGRAFLPEEDQPGGRPVVLISYSLWQRRFAADRGVIGRTVTLDSKDYTIIGVMPLDFQFALLGPAVDVWAPRVFDLNIATPQQIRGGASYLTLVARLRPGASLAAAQAEMDVLSRRYREANPAMADAAPQIAVLVSDLQQALVLNIRSALLILFGAVGLVLLIACANVANLLLSRMLGRKREIAVRAALGAPRSRIMRQLLTESVVLALLSGALGVLLSLWGTTLLSRVTQSMLPRQGDIAVDGRVLAFALVASLLTGVSFGLVPALQLSKPDLNPVLRDEGRGATSGKQRGAVRNLLVVSQVALSLILLIGSGLLIRSFLNLIGSRPGFNPDNLLTMNITLPPARYPTGQAMTGFTARALQEVRTLPGVESAAISSALPVNPTRESPALMEGQPELPFPQRPIVVIEMVSPSYFETMGIPLLRGRRFTDHDVADTPQILIVNDTLARRYWPGENPIGKRITVGRLAPIEVVGVVADIKNVGLSLPPSPEIYFPFPQRPWSSVNLIVRTVSEPRATLGGIRRRLAAIDRNQPITNVQTADELLAASRTQPRLTMLLLTVFSGCALLLAAIGVYGLITYSIVQRTQELGIRMALGASKADILKLVLGQGLPPTLAGIVLGLGASFALTRVLSGLVYQITVTDPFTYVASALVFTAIAFLATIVPARRAAQIDPTDALRYG